MVVHVLFPKTGSFVKSRGKGFIALSPSIYFRGYMIGKKAESKLIVLLVAIILLVLILWLMATGYFENPIEWLQRMGG